jgi:hypothetical protein
MSLLVRMAQGKSAERPTGERLVAGRMSEPQAGERLNSPIDMGHLACHCVRYRHTHVPVLGLGLYLSEENRLRGTPIILILENNIGRRRMRRPVSIFAVYKNVFKTAPGCVLPMGFFELAGQGESLSLIESD